MNRSEKFWNRTARKYNRKEKSEEDSYGGYIDKIKRYLKKDDVVLDFGCGTGLISIGIAGSVKKITAVDTSSALIEIAKSNAAERGVANIEYSCSSVFENSHDQYDVILVLYVFHLLDDIPSVMDRLNQLLKPGGIIISSTPCMGEKNHFLAVLLKLAALFGIVPKINVFRLDQLTGHFSDAGFKVQRTELIDKNGNQYFIVSGKP